MKNILMTLSLVLGLMFSAAAQTDQKPLANERTGYITEQMIKDLKLNNFQAARMRAINQSVITRFMTAEQQYASDPVAQDKACKGICQQRDKQVEDVLSTDQYSKYFSSRNQYLAMDRQFAQTKQLATRKAPQDPVTSGK